MGVSSGPVFLSKNWSIGVEVSSGLIYFKKKRICGIIVPKLETNRWKLKMEANN